MSLRLLLVEDELEAQAALARALTRTGYLVVCEQTAAGALARLDEHLPEVAVLDVRLGDDEDGGLRILEELRARAPEAIVVIVTAFADVAKVKRALNLGASHLIEKPFRAVDLTVALERLLAARPDPARAVRERFASVGLTPREAEVALYALKGLSSPEIAQVLGMSDKTVRQHLSKVYEKHGVSGRGELVHLLFPI